MSEGKLYRHRRFLDIDLYVLQVKKRSKYGVRLYGALLLRKSGAVLEIAHYTIKPSEYVNWREVYS